MTSSSAWFTRWVQRQIKRAVEAIQKADPERVARVLALLQTALQDGKITAGEAWALFIAVMTPSLAPHVEARLNQLAQP